MASQMAMPMEGHLEVVLHVFAFIHQKYNYRISFYQTFPAINMIYFK